MNQPPPLPSNDGRLSPKRTVRISVLVVAVIAALIVGGISGFVIGVASTKFGMTFLKGLADKEQKAEVSQPKVLAGEGFQLKYPGNWKVDTDDEDYDPDSHFSIDSPGSAFVQFAIGNGELNPEDMVQHQITAFTKLMGNPSIRTIEKYGQFTGKGAVLNGRIMGIRTTVKVFSMSQSEKNVMITQQYPDEDEEHVQGGMGLVENSFSLNGGSKADK